MDESLRSRPSDGEVEWYDPRGFARHPGRSEGRAEPTPSLHAEHATAEHATACYNPTVVVQYHRRFVAEMLAP